MDVDSAHQITGRTKISFCIGDPIGHVRSPGAFNRLVAERGVDAIMVPYHVLPQNLATTISIFRATPNIAGFIVTMPHKETVVKLCDELDQNAKETGVANVVRRTADGRLICDALDGVGFVEGLKRSEIGFAGRSVYLAGAGGAAKAIAFALARGGIAGLQIYNRTPNKARELASQVAKLYPAVKVSVAESTPAANIDIAVNATSLGLRPEDPLPFELDRLGSHCVVADVIIHPEKTLMLQTAAGRGLKTVGGGAMLMGQLSLIADYIGFVRV